MAEPPGTGTASAKVRAIAGEGPEQGREQKIAEAQRIWRECRGLHGTVAEQYLVETRGIPRPASGRPAVLGYHAATQSLVLAATLANGAVQRVLLTLDAKNQRNAAGQKLKLSRGPQEVTSVNEV